MAMHMVMHIMPCVAVCPCAHAGPQGHGHAPPGGFTGKPVTICLGRARALHRRWRWHWRWAEGIGIIHQHRCCSPAAGTDMAVVRRPKHWKQIRSKHHDGRPSSSIPSQTPGPPFCRCDAVSTPSVLYLATVTTMPVFSARASTSVPTPHTTRHTHPSPPLAKLPSTVTSTTLPAPSHVLRTLHHAPGPGVEVGWARFHYAVPWYLYSPQYCVASAHVRTVQDGHAPSPHLLHLIPRRPLVSQLGRDGSPTRVVNDSGRADGNIAIVH